MLRTANPPFVGSIPASASYSFKKYLELTYTMKYIRNLFITISIILSANLSLADPLYEYDYSFENPLIDAADAGNEYEVSRLLRSGSSPNGKGLFNSTALMRASLRGGEDIVRQLLESGADVHAKDIGGATALHFATRAGNKKVVDLLLRYGASPDVNDNEGYSPIKRAITAQNVSIVDVLIKKGADLDTKGSSGVSARDLVNSSRNQQIKAILDEESKKSLTQQPLLGIPNDDVSITPLEKPSTPTASKIEPIITEVTKIAENKEIEEKETFSPKSEVKVEEAIKLPKDMDLKSATTKIQTTPPVSTTPAAKEITLKSSETSPRKILRDLSMEIGGFDSEENAIIFWQNVTEKNVVEKKKARLVIDNTTNITKYKIRFDGYSSSPDVFENCKKVKSLKNDSLCYVIHNIY